MESLHFRSMGCQMFATLDSAGREVGVALSRVPRWFAEWERTLSRFSHDSELSRVNQHPGQPVRVSTVFWEVLSLALDAARWTDGLIVPTLLGELEAAGYDRSFEYLVLGQLVSDGMLSAAVKGGPAVHGGGLTQQTKHGRALVARSAASHPTVGATSASVPTHVPSDDRLPHVDASARTVTLPDGIRLDFGGIAKGWAADRAARRLSPYGPALVDAGGDIAVSGPMANGDCWPIGIADPLAPSQLLDVLLIGTGGVATSGRDYRRWLHDGTAQHHILDPRTRRPAETDVLTATVVAPTAAMADVAAKTVLILGSHDGMQWLDAQPLLAGLVVRYDGQVLRNDRLHPYLG